MFRLGTRIARKDIALGILLLVFSDQQFTNLNRYGEFPRATLGLYVAKLLQFFVGQGVPTLDSSGLCDVNSGH